MRARRKSRAQCARCGGPQRHASMACASCRECGCAICARHAIADPESGGWLCTRCERDRSRRAG